MDTRIVEESKSRNESFTGSPLNSAEGASWLKREVIVAVLCLLGGLGDDEQGSATVMATGTGIARTSVSAKPTNGTQTSKGGAVGRSKSMIAAATVRGSSGGRWPDVGFFPL